jgi:hypothetical protein
VFRGSGFYITDYGKDGKGPRKAEDKAGGEKPAEKQGEAAGAKETKKAEPASKPAPSGREGKAKPE